MASDRSVLMITPLAPIDGEEALRFAALQGHDAISRCFTFEVLALSVDPDIDDKKLLGQGITVSTIADTEDPETLRHFHGLVDRFAFEGNDDDGFFRYRLTLRPQLWFLSKTMDNRIFQRMTAVEIIEQVFADQGLTDYELRLNGTYPAREYCVQYHESDLDFVQRLMEHEGIFYHFEYDEGIHRLILVDDVGNLEPAIPAKELRFEPNASTFLDGYGVITRLERQASAVPASFTHTDYDFTKPSADLMANSENPQGHSHDDKARYDYPGIYTEHARGKDLVTIRNEEDQALAQTVRARSTAPSPAAGRVFDLIDYPREVENQQYFVLRADYELWDGQYLAGESRDTDEGFEAHYRLVPVTTPFRPARITPHPVMRGPQTAVVVGPAGEEIHTDEFSRVRVQFHWDRVGKNDENSSCFVRVSAAWAGAGWGFIQIPRIGQEVIVDFLEGDPDQPIITGRVYNAEQMPPYELPANATQSGWKSNSSPGGGGWNELRFEDMKGEEEVYFQAEKDHNELVKNNESRQIGNDFFEDIGNDATQNVHHDRTETVDNNKDVTVGVDRTVAIGSNDTETVGSNRSLTVGVDETIAIGANSTETIGSNHTQSVGTNQTITVGAMRTDTVAAVETRTVGAAQVNTIGAARSVSVGAIQSHDVGLSDSWDIGTDQDVSVGASRSLTIGKDHGVKIGGGWIEEVGKKGSLTIGEDLTIDVGKKLVIEAGDSILIKCGKASITMKKDGSITIDGKDIATKASGKTSIKASSSITIKGSKISQN